MVPEEIEMFNCLLRDPKRKHHGFKLIDFYIYSYIPTNEQLGELLEAGAVIDPSTCVRNYRYGLVEFLIKENLLKPDDHIHDICLIPYHGDRPYDFLSTLKILVERGANLDGLDSQNRTPLECLKSNRGLRWIGEIYIRSVLKNRQETIQGKK